MLRLSVEEVDEAGAHDDDQSEHLGVGEVILKINFDEIKTNRDDNNKMHHI